ncbi:MAG: hypothetical protein A2096_17020 [Spirochaetes bacterium GWF1_41_5]|nr:MAG: hypothetical protein A2096_17020 [Spirochaetes bacterium GWF1_41_5]HBE00968.1 hypothetical protein [Spirochaetia bacterium]
MNSFGLDRELDYYISNRRDIPELLKKKYNSLHTKDIYTIARKQKASYIIFEKQNTKLTNIIYNNEVFFIYKVDIK